MVIFFLSLLLFLFFFKILKTKENMNLENCLSKRNGISGCRDCCSKQTQNYSICVSKCMNY